MYVYNTTINCILLINPKQLKETKNYYSFDLEGLLKLLISVICLKWIKNILRQNFQNLS